MTSRVPPAVCRVLFACFLFTLWCGAVIATDATSAGAKDSHLLKGAKEPKSAGEKAAEAQEKITSGVEGMLKDLAGVLVLVTPDDPQKALPELADAQAMNRTLQTLNTTAHEAQTAVARASKETNEVLGGAKKLTGDAAGPGGVKQKAEEWQKRADEVAKSWREVAEKADTQHSEADKVLKEAEKLKTKMEAEAKSGRKTPADEERELLGNVSTRLTVGLKKTTDDATTLKVSAQTAESEIKKAASQVSTLVASTQDVNMPDSGRGNAVATWTKFPLLFLTAVIYAVVC